MALRITQSTKAERAKAYFREGFSRDDYYSEGQEVTGSWGGRAARMLKLSGDVDRDAFFALAENRDPNSGDRLTQRTRANRRVGYDFTFSVPKSVSLHQALTGDEEIVTAFEAAVSDTMRRMEADMETRIRRDGRFASRETGNMVWAGFTHFTARPSDRASEKTRDKGRDTAREKRSGADPHLHRHVFAFNATWDEEEGRWKAGDFGTLHRRRPYWEAWFHARLAQNLRELGYETPRTARNFEIQGYETQTLRRFSSRTQQIEEVAEAAGPLAPEQKAELGARTRGSKQKAESREEMQRRWWSELTRKERETVRNIEIRRDRPPVAAAAEPAEIALKRALDGCLERKSVVTKDALLTAAMKAGIAAHGPEAAHDAVDRAAETGEILVAPWDGQDCVTTPQIQDEERRVLDYVRRTRGQSAPLLADDDALPESRSGRPRPEDWDVAARRLLSSRDRVAMLIGRPGSGKTTVMQTVSDAIESRGQSLLAFAPSSLASRENQAQAGFGQAETMAMLLQSGEIQERARGQVIWIDEAGMVGVRDMARLFDLAEEFDARLILTGDPNQHKPVDRGDAMRVLTEFGQITPARLNVIRRQSEAQYRQAATEIAEGRVLEGFDRLQSIGAVIETPDWEERTRQIATDYGTHRIDRGKSVLVVSPTHAEREAVSDAIRSELTRRGVVDAECSQTVLQWKNRGLQVSEKADPVFYAPGDRIKFHKAAPGVAAGMALTVRDVSEGVVRAENAQGTILELPLDKSDRFDVFEASTIEIAVGDEIRITRNGFAESRDPSGRKQRVTNGRVYRVAGFEFNGDIRLDNGFVLDRDYAHLTHGYAVTSHASQSLAADVVLVAQSAASFGASSEEQFLVSVTRGREAVRIYTDDRDGLEQAIQRSAARVSATELVGEAQIVAGTQDKERSPFASLVAWLQSLAPAARARGSELRARTTSGRAPDAIRRDAREGDGIEADRERA